MARRKRLNSIVDDESRGGLDMIVICIVDRRSEGSYCDAQNNGHSLFFLFSLYL
jgi:hypothetical protein